MGLYAVLWGKNREMIRPSAIEETAASRKLGQQILMENVDHDLELQLNGKSNGNHHYHHHHHDVTARDQENQAGNKP